MTKINTSGESIDGPAVAFQGNYGGDEDHGNLELLASLGGRVVHYFRDATDLSWHRSTQVSRYAFHYFTGWNRNTPTLMCNRFTDSDIGHGQLGVSQAVDGMIAAGLQDNGVVAAVTGPTGTPWVQLGGGDGNEAGVAGVDVALLHRSGRRRPAGVDPRRQQRRSKGISRRP